MQGCGVRIKGVSVIKTEISHRGLNQVLDKKAGESLTEDNSSIMSKYEVISLMVFEKTVNNYKKAIT